MTSIKKQDKEFTRKARQQQKRQRKIERRKAASKSFPRNPGATGISSPVVKTNEGAMTGDLRARLASRRRGITAQRH